MKQYELLRRKILKQASIVLSKFKVKENSKEVTNQDLAILLYSYSVGTPISDEKLELIHDRMARLDERQMNVIRLTYWEGKTQHEIASIMGMSRSWVDKELGRCMEVMREKRRDEGC